MLAGNLQGISSIRGPTARQHQKKTGIKSGRYEPIPYASEQGIFCGLAGNLNRRSGKFPPRSGNPALVRYLGPTGPTNPILPRDLERCREAKRDAARCSRSRGPRYAENRSPSTRRQARRSRAAPGRCGSGRAPGGIQRARTGVMPRKLIVNMAIPFLIMTKPNRYKLASRRARSLNRRRTRHLTENGAL